MKYANLILTAALMCTSFTATADSRFSVGTRLGSADLSADFDGFNFDASDRTASLYGAWHPSDNLSLEVGYQTFGEFTEVAGATTARIKADGFTLGVRGVLPLSQRFSLEGRLGSFFWDGNASINDVTQATPSDTNLFLGGGAAWQLNDTFSLTASWTRFNLDDADVDVLSAGVELRF